MPKKRRKTDRKQAEKRKETEKLKRCLCRGIGLRLCPLPALCLPGTSASQPAVNPRSRPPAFKLKPHSYFAIFTEEAAGHFARWALPGAAAGRAVTQ